MLEKKLKHLEFVENVINRMNSNSFAIKGWAVTVVSALYCLIGQRNRLSFRHCFLRSLVHFWLMDAYYPGAGTHVPRFIRGNCRQSG